MPIQIPEFRTMKKTTFLGGGGLHLHSSQGVSEKTKGATLRGQISFAGSVVDGPQVNGGRLSQATLL